MPGYGQAANQIVAGEAPERPGTHDQFPSSPGWRLLGEAPCLSGAGQGKEALQSSLHDLASRRTYLVSDFSPVRWNAVRTVRSDCADQLSPNWDLAAAAAVLLLLLMSQ